MLPPQFSPIKLKAVVEALMEGGHSLKVLHIVGRSNTCADLLSRNKIAAAKTLFPTLRVQTLEPPPELMGAVEK
ncbi:hypothetical protein H0H92_011334 [Tricholoma furcatifolium]|nr:hypothetical protein H0H92_011334 [Tricholoma furcatifolium]